jgi:HD-GYP domain-containing protein (c-di-GMP phosphodiesterase class II)
MGQGYPDGLQGTEIPLEAQIVRISDTYDALRHHRGYRQAYSRADAEKIMTEEQIKRQWANADLFHLFMTMKRDY